MKRCPKCSRIADDEQKFCVFDGGRLVDIAEGSPEINLNETMSFTPPRQQEKPSAEFDPLKTMISPPPPPPSRAPSQKLESNDALFKTIASPPPPSAAQPPASSFPAPETAPPPRAASVPLTPPVTQTPPVVPQPPVQQQPAPPQATMQPQPTSSQMAAQTPAPLVTPQPTRKSNKLLWIIAGVIVLLLLLVGAGGIIAFLYASREGLIKTSTNRNTNVSVQSNTNTGESVNTSVASSANENKVTNTNANSNVEPPPPPNSEKFVNARSKFTGKLADHFVDFSFYYPKNWALDKQAGTRDSNNFVEVERKLPPDLTQEKIAVSYYDSQGTMDADRARFPELVKTLSDKLAKSFPEYQKVSEGETRVGSIAGYEFRFQSISRNTDHGDINIWGRVVYLPPGGAGERSGVTLLMVTTSLAKELSGVEDVGLKGELPVILNSFRFGANR